ncbi:hypothetical protein ACNSO7_24555 [Yersinia enterocolitica]
MSENFNGYGETPSSLNLTRTAAFAIRLVAIAVLIWAVRWW